MNFQELDESEIETVVERVSGSKGMYEILQAALRCGQSYQVVGTQISLLIDAEIEYLHDEQTEEVRDAQRGAGHENEYD